VIGLWLFQPLAGRVGTSPSYAGTGIMDAGALPREAERVCNALTWVSPLTPTSGARRWRSTWRLACAIRRAKAGRMDVL